MATTSFRITKLKKLIDLIKSKYLPFKDRILNGENFLIEINSSEINNSEHNKLVEKMFKDIFDLKDFKLIWYTSPKSGASTPTCPLSFLDPNYKKDEKGHRINNKLFIGVYLYTGLITYSNLNEKELLAVILHEIGHFETTQSVMVHIGLMGKVASLIAMPVASGFYRQLINGSFAMYMNAIGRYVEIQADKFATARGYGNELVSGLAKLSGSKINPNQKYDNNEVHSDVNLRMNTILKYAPLYDKINKQAIKD